MTEVESMMLTAKIRTVLNTAMCKAGLPENIEGIEVRCLNINAVIYEGIKRALADKTLKKEQIDG